MPFLNVKLTGLESLERSAKIAAVLTDLTVDVLKKKRELIAVAIEFVVPERWFIGATSLHEQAISSFYLDIKVTEGTNTKDEKSRYVAEVFAALEAIIGALAPASYIVVQEVHADAWGYQGQTQEFRYVRGKVL
ncbi:MAG: tautomerase family protein [Betaproteobacteria bacterium]